MRGLWMSNYLRSAALLVALSLAVPLSMAGTPSWLLGRWELKFDPDGSEKDFLEFNTGGQVINISPTGRQMTGIYVLKEEGVKTSFVLPNGKMISATMIPSDNKRELRMKNSPTGKFTVYEKAKP